MDAALHAGHFDNVDSAYDQISRVTDGSGAGEVRDIRIGNFLGTCKFVGESAKAGTENQRDAWAKRRLRKYKISGFAGAFEFTIG
jgi:hypothetical protein